MASANIMKATSKTVAAMRVHLDTRERVSRNHSNVDIDKARTEENYFLGADSWDDMRQSWEQDLARCDELHPPKRVKSDRVTALMVECPCPWEVVDQGHEKEFFEMYLEHLKECFGEEHVHGLTVHRDEVHDYLDKIDGEVVERTSMIHAHALVTPYARWEDKTGDREGVNAKNLVTRSFLQDFQKGLDSKCKERFGVDFHTHGLARGESVELIKRRAEAERETLELEREIQHKNRVLDETERALEKTLQESREQEAVLEELSAQVHEREREALEAHMELSRLQEALDKLKAQIKAKMSEFEALSAKVKEFFDFEKKDFVERCSVADRETERKVHRLFELVRSGRVPSDELWDAKAEWSHTIAREWGIPQHTAQAILDKYMAREELIDLKHEAEARIKDFKATISTLDSLEDRESFAREQMRYKPVVDYMSKHEPELLAQIGKKLKIEELAKAEKAQELADRILGER